MRLGYIDYLNCYPYYHGLLQNQPPGIEIFPDYPSGLNEKIQNGFLDMSPVSSGAFPGFQGDVLLHNEFCLSSVGYVRSVVLMSRAPIEELGGARVGLTMASQTSVILLKILLEKHYGLKPLYEPALPRPDLAGLDAVLVIGNDAMTGLCQDARYIYDLGDLWMRKTGYPVVFAVFAVRKTSAEKYGEEIKFITETFRSSLDLLGGSDPGLIESAVKKYPEVKCGAAEYYRLLKYDFTPQMKGALMFYFSEAASLGLLEPVKEISYYRP